MKYNNSGAISWKMVTKLIEIGEEELVNETPISKILTGISDGDGGLNASIDFVLESQGLGRWRVDIICLHGTVGFHDWIDSNSQGCVGIYFSTTPPDISTLLTDNDLTSLFVNNVGGR